GGGTTRASRSEGLRVVSIFTCWASAGRAIRASSAATTAIRIGMRPFYIKITPSPRLTAAARTATITGSPRLRLRLAVPLSPAQPHEFADGLQPIEAERGALERGQARGGQRAPRVVAELLDEGLGRQRAVGAAAPVRHACLELAAVREAHAHPARERPGKRRVGIDHVAHARRQAQDALVPETRRRVGVDAHGAVEERR